MKESVIESIVKFDSRSGLGYHLKTSNKGYVKIKMENGSICCEQFYANAMQNKKNMDTKLHTFVGKTITEIQYTEKKNAEEEGVYYIQVTIHFNRGDPLHFYLTNEHNGYYPHACSLDWSLYIQDVPMKKSVVTEI